MTKFKAKMIAIVVAILLIAVFTAVSFAVWNNLSASDDRVTVHTGSTTNVTITVGDHTYGNTKQLVPKGEIMNKDMEDDSILLEIPVEVKGNINNVKNLTSQVSNIKFTNKNGEVVTIEGESEMVSITTDAVTELKDTGSDKSKVMIYVYITDLLNDARLADCVLTFTFTVTANAINA